MNILEKNSKILSCISTSYFRLDHPNILKLYHSFEDDQRFYIISELCEGGTLSQYVEDHYPLKEAEVLIIMK